MVSPCCIGKLKFTALKMQPSGEGTQEGVQQEAPEPKRARGEEEGDVGTSGR